MADITVPPFVQIACGQTNELYGLDQDGRVWEWYGYGGWRLKTNRLFTKYMTWEEAKEAGDNV